MGAPLRFDLHLRLETTPASTSSPTVHSMTVQTTSAPHLYVLGEVEVAGPVKIGITRSRRPGLNTGNWRELEVLHEHPVDGTLLRWTEYLIHRRLQHRHVRGEWFCVRDLAVDDWPRFLDAVIAGDGTVDVFDFRLAANGHALDRVEQTDGPKRNFAAFCTTCGEVDGVGPGRAMPTVIRHFALTHLCLPAGSSRVVDLRPEMDRRRHGNLTRVQREGSTLGAPPCAGSSCGH